jgi:hypothetical protein
MSTTVLVEPELSQALSARILPKLGEVGWSTGSDDDGNLAEYIVLLVVNGKTQDEIAAELSGDLLNLGPDDPQVQHFSQWLFEQVNDLKAQGGAELHADGSSAMVQDGGAGDAIMGDGSEGGEPNMYAISSLGLSHDPLNTHGFPDFYKILTAYPRPTGPKSMRNGGARSNPRDKRMLGHLAKAMDRSHESVLHRVRATGGNERINTHRAPPTGPRQALNIRGGARAMNGRANGMAMQQGQSWGNDNTTQSAEMFYAILQQQQAFFNQLPPDQQQALHQQMLATQANPSFNPNFQSQQQSGKSLFDRVQAPPHRQQNGYNNGHQHSKFGDYKNDTPSSSMDVQMSQENPELSTDATCRYNLSCTNKDCKFAHQSPEAPPGTTIDLSDTCSFGAACKNRKCTGRHPSPAQRAAHNAQKTETTDCKFNPNCTNPKCPYRHPPMMPSCRNGADCTVPDCKFTHVKTPCRFNPCLNPSCIFKHEEGQKRGKFEDKVWVKEHVSERKFVDDEGKPEELIVPGATGEEMSQASSGTAEVIT